MEELKFEVGEIYQSIPVITGRARDYDRPMIDVISRIDDTHIRVKIVFQDLSDMRDEVVETKMVHDSGKIREYFPVYNGSFFHSVYASHLIDRPICGTCYLFEGMDDDGLCGVDREFRFCSDICNIGQEQRESWIRYIKSMVGEKADYYKYDG